MDSTPARPTRSPRATAGGAGAPPPARGPRGPRRAPTIRGRAGRHVGRREPAARLGSGAGVGGPRAVAPSGTTPPRRRGLGAPATEASPGSPDSARPVDEHPLARHERVDRRGLRPSIRPSMISSTWPRPRSPPRAGGAPGGAPPGDARQRGEDLAQRHVLVAQDVAPPGAPRSSARRCPAATSQGHQFQAGVDVGRHPSGEEVGHDPPGGGRRVVAGPTGAVGFTTATWRPSAAAASARRSDATFDRLYAPITCAGGRGCPRRPGCRPRAGRRSPPTTCGPRARPPGPPRAGRCLYRQRSSGAPRRPGGGPACEGGDVEDGVGPAGRALDHLGASRRSPATGSQPSGRRPDPMLCGRTRRAPPIGRARRWEATWPPTNPVAPVTSAVLTSASGASARARRAAPGRPPGPRAPASRGRASRRWRR